MSPFRLGVIIGHTRLSPGAYSPHLGTVEYSWNTKLAVLMMAVETPGVELAGFFRDGGGVPKAYAEAADWGADATVELHFNAAAPSATGTETLYAPGSLRGRALAQKVQEAMVGVLHLPDRHAKEPYQGRGLASLTALPVPAVIVEPFFGTNRTDCEQAELMMQPLAAAIVRGAVEWWRAEGT